MLHIIVYANGVFLVHTMRKMQFSGDNSCRW